MKKHGINIAFELDEFHKVVTRGEFYGSIELCKQLHDEYMRRLRNTEFAPEGSAGIRLALLWIRLVRGLKQDNEEVEWKEIQQQIGSQGDLIQIEYDTIRAIYMLLRHNEYQESRKILERVTAELRQTPYNLLYGIAARALSNVYIMTGETGLGDAYALDAISIFRRFGNKMLLASCLNSYAILKKNCCQYEEAERLLNQALEIFDHIEAPDGSFLCLNNLAIVKMKTGDWARAEACFQQLARLETELCIRSNNLLVYRVNRAHLHLLKRNFRLAESELQELASEDSDAKAFKQRALAHEFLGELYTEVKDLEKARTHIECALSLADNIAPESDLMTEILRRKVKLLYEEGNSDSALANAMRCIKLCKKIRDRHELGAILRILGDIYSRNNQSRKANSCYQYSAILFTELHQRYELMRTYIAQAASAMKAKCGGANFSLAEAYHIATQMGLEYYAVRCMVLLGRYATRNAHFKEARTYLRKAMNSSMGLEGNDSDEIKALQHDAYRELDRAVALASFNAADKLKTLGRIYEEARFPVEEAGPRLATEIAHTVAAESLFLVRKRNGGYAIPFKYNISADKARRLVKRIRAQGSTRLFNGKYPTELKLGNGSKLVGIADRKASNDSLCVIINDSQQLTEKNMEFLYACLEAVERIADAQLKRRSREKQGKFIDETRNHPGESFSRIITADPEMIRLIKLAKRAGRTDVPVLLQGETGVGKELFARAIHETSSRNEAQCVVINTGGIPVNFLESELFGHTRGAFTDARTEKTGLVEEARGGTLFLDEIGEMCEEIQIKLLRLIENGEYRKLGDNKLRTADVRIISATNKALPALIEQGKFREDLYYRLSTVRFVVPPLRYRKHDIELLVRQMIALSFDKLCVSRRHLEIDQQALEALKIYDWPGNVRELQNEILRLVSLMGNAGRIEFTMLSSTIQDYFRSSDRTSHHEQRVEQYERALILRALEENDWNRFKTAAQIGIPRTTLLAKMRRLNITS